jgi:predicted DNA-binding transcriptional regulator YafY
MRKASRLFEIIQILRLARQPTTAAMMAAQLEVTVRSIYRDIAALQAMRVPIDGERGLGYILRPGFDLPPLMFSVEETEALVVALALLERNGDTELRNAARRVSDKIAGAVPAPLRRTFTAQALHAWGPVTSPPQDLDLALVRRAIRNEQKLVLNYRDASGQPTLRTVCPLAIIYYSDAVIMIAWCDMRQAVRQFRVDRVEHYKEADGSFKGRGDGLRALWIEGWTPQADARSEAENPARLPAEALDLQAVGVEGDDGKGGLVRRVDHALEGDEVGDGGALQACR